jgi:hypothetical protein
MPGAMRCRLARRRAPVALVALVALLAAAAGARAQEPRAAEEVYTNIEVLRGTPAEQVLPAMELISASLGVACEHCHVAGAFEADDKPAKQTAREMVRMMRAINRDSFEGRLAVTCWSCHRGAARPAAEPPPAPDGTAAVAIPSPAAAAGGLEEAPGVIAAEVVARHVEAAGGAAAARAIVSRRARGTVTLFGARGFPVEIRQAAPLSHSMVLELPGGARVSTLDGPAGTVETPGRPKRPMNGAEIAVAALAVDFGWLARPEEALTGLRVAGRRGAGGRELIVVEARVEGHPVELSFDRDGGLLRHVLAWAETPVGRLSTEVEILDYREVDGLATPAAWTVARPEGRFTVRLAEIEQETAPRDAPRDRAAEPAP